MGNLVNRRLSVGIKKTSDSSSDRHEAYQASKNADEHQDPIGSSVLTYETI
jgi:hypothetical protein